MLHSDCHLIPLLKLKLSFIVLYSKNDFRIGSEFYYLKIKKASASKILKETVLYSELTEYKPRFAKKPEPTNMKQD